ncbi:hypothetical protein ACPV5L_03980 [Vibrio astriarenae]
MRRILTILTVLLLMNGCTAPPTEENGCDGEGIETTRTVANTLGVLSLADLFTGGDSYKRLSAHAVNFDQEADIRELQVESCLRKVDDKPSS